MALDLQEETLLDKARELPVAAIQTGRPRFELLSAERITNVARDRYLIAGVIPEKGIGVIAGVPGCGKSFLCLDALAAVSSGGAWFGLATQSCRVLYIGLEGAGGLGARVEALRHSGRDCSQMRFMTTSFNLRDQDDRAELIAAIRMSGFRPGIIAVDTLARASAGADENNGRDMSEIIAGLTELQEALGSAVIAVHHMGKDASKGLRGHSSLLAAMDFVIEIHTDRHGRKWRLTKAKDAPDGCEHRFELRAVQVRDADGFGPVTSCSVAPNLAALPPRRQPSLGENQQVAIEAVKRLLEAQGTPNQHAEAGDRPCVAESDALKSAIEALTTEPKRRKERAMAALAGLTDRNLLVIRDGWVWLP